MKVSNFLKRIRQEKTISVKKMVMDTVFILLFGIALGVFSKFLDGVPSNEQPAFFTYLDIGNFMGRLPVWLVIASVIAVCSSSAKRAAVNVFAFFAGMVSAYYLYSNFIAGFFPKSYAMIWVGLTLLSPFLAGLCWYAKGDGWAAVVLSAMMLGAMSHLTVYLGVGYISIASPLDMFMLLLAVLLLWRKDKKELLAMLGIAFFFLLLLQNILGVVY